MKKKENFNFQYNSWESTSESSIDELNSNQDNICQYEDIKRKHNYSIQDQTEMNVILYSYPHPDSERADTVKEVFFLKSDEIKNWSYFSFISWNSLCKDPC